MKLNIDVAFDLNAEAGWILGNEYRHSMGGCMMALGGIDNPALAEALYMCVKR